MPMFEIIKQNKHFHILSPLSGNYQLENISTVLNAVQILDQKGFTISDANITEGIKSVKLETGLLGRWEIIKLDPLTICDVAHNEAGLKAVFEQINSIPHKNLRIIYGMVKDKDIEKALNLLPNSATYYFSQPKLPRALDADSLYIAAQEKGLKGQKFESIKQAYKQAQNDADADDIVLVAGSIFVVAEVLAFTLPSSKSTE
jgi:dihydrofolate synthase / folylpolyglutamate synthase